MNYVPSQFPRAIVPGDPNEEQRRKIEEEREAAEASWNGITESQVRAKVRALEGHPMRPILGRMLATALRRHEPKLLSHLPPEFLEPTP